MAKDGTNRGGARLGAGRPKKALAQKIIKLRSSLREFVFVNPVIIDRENNILCGHGRVTAAK